MKRRALALDPPLLPNSSPQAESAERPREL